MTYMCAKVPAERAGVVSLHPLDVRRTEHFSLGLGRAPAQLKVVDLVLTPDPVSADRLDRLTEIGHTRLLGRLGRDLCVRARALADEGLQRRFNDWCLLLCWLLRHLSLTQSTVLYW